MTVAAPLVAVIVTVSPSAAPLAPTVGVASFVSLSLVELPVSEEASRSGVFGAEIAATVILSVDVVALLKTSVTEYESGVTVPVKPLDGVKVTMPVDVFTAHSPWPLTVTLCSVHVGGVSLVPHSSNELAAIPVPVSLSSGDKVMALVTTPDAESVRAEGRAGG